MNARPWLSCLVLVTWLGGARAAVVCAQLTNSPDAPASASPTAAEPTPPAPAAESPATAAESPATAAESPAPSVTWSPAQPLPRFPTPAATLDALNVDGLTADEQLTFSALQGQVNRTQPRLLLLDPAADEGPETWPSTPTVGLGPRTTYDASRRYELLAKYAEEATGVVLYDPERSPHYRNLAATAAALRRALPATREVHAEMAAQGVDLPVAEDLTALPAAAPREVYERLYRDYWPRCARRLLLSAKPYGRSGDYHHTRDIAAACGVAALWLDPRIPGERDLLRRFLAEMELGNSLVLGWYATERSGVTTASEFGIGTLPADFYQNGSVYAGTDAAIRTPPIPRLPALENKCYVALFLSDGDNIQYVQHALRRIWDASANSRGRLALNWTIAPGLVDLGPGLLNYYFDSATPQDCFVAGPSGMGYVMPFNTLDEPGAPVGAYLTDPARMDGYARLTAQYLRRAGLRCVTIWDHATPRQRVSYAAHCRDLWGATVQNFRDVPSVAGSVEAERLRFDKLVNPYATTYDDLLRSLRRALDRWDGRTPAFIACQASIWGEVRPAKALQLANELQRLYPGQVQFVRADHYFQLYNQAHGLPWNLTLMPQTVVTASGDDGDAGLACDGAAHTVWSTVAAEPWLQLDFGAEYALRRVVLRRPPYDASHAGPSSPPTFDASVDGSAWQRLAPTTDQGPLGDDLEFASPRLRYLRVTFAPPQAGEPTCLADLEAYGVAPAAEAPPETPQ